MIGVGSREVLEYTYRSPLNLQAKSPQAPFQPVMQPMFASSLVCRPYMFLDGVGFWGEPTIAVN